MNEPTIANTASVRSPDTIRPKHNCDNTWMTCDAKCLLFIQEVPNRRSIAARTYVKKKPYVHINGVKLSDIKGRNKKPDAI